MGGTDMTWVWDGTMKHCKNAIHTTSINITALVVKRLSAN